LLLAMLLLLLISAPTPAAVTTAATRWLPATWLMPTTSWLGGTRCLLVLLGAALRTRPPKICNCGGNDA